MTVALGWNGQSGFCSAIGKDGIYMCWAVEYLGKSNNP